MLLSLPSLVTRHQFLPVILARVAATRNNTRAVVIQTCSCSSNRLFSSSCSPHSASKQCLRPHRARCLPLNLPQSHSCSTTGSMASASMADDLQLLQQEYEQLQSALGFSDPGSGLVEDRFPHAEAEQVMTSSPAAAAAAATNTPTAPVSKRKRRKVASLPPAKSKHAAGASSPSETPPHSTTTTGRTAAAAAAEDSAAAAAAATTEVIEPALHMVTPPAKAPRSRRGTSSKRGATPAAAAATQLPFATAGVADDTAAVQLLASTTTTPNTARTTAVAAAAAAAAAVAPREVAAPVAASTKKRSRGKRAALTEEQQVQSAAGTVALPAAAADVPADLVPTTPAKKTRSRKRKAPVATEEEEVDHTPATVITSSTPAAAAGAAVDSAELAAEEEEAPLVKSTRSRRKSTTTTTNSKTSSKKGRARSRSAPAPAAAAAEGSSEDAAGEPDDAAAAAAAKPAKPVRRTKKVIAAEVLEAASQGQFGELTNLAGTYSHVALFTNSSNTAAWQQLMQQQQQQQQGGHLQHPLTPADTHAAAAAVTDAADQQQQQQQPKAACLRLATASNAHHNNSTTTTTITSNPSLCRVSGLGSFKQQVWIHSQSQAEDAAPPLAATPSQQQQQQDSHAQGSNLPAAMVQLTAPLTAGSAPAAAGGAGGDVDDDDDGNDVDGGRAAASPHAASQPTLTVEQQQQQQLKVLPNLGYACLCMTMRQYDIFNSRDCVKKTREGPGGLQKVSELALQNARDLVPLIHWNEAHGVRLFRLSSNIFPWMSTYTFEELPHWTDIQKALRAAGDLAKQLGHRLTFHPSEYCKIAGERPAWVDQSVKELEVHSRIFDEMGFLPATPYNKINIHVGGTYGDKEAALERFSKVVNERLSPNCKARLTVENDDRASLYSVVDLMKVHRATGIPIVFDFHHWKFCTGNQTQEDAFRTALTTWPAGVRPVVHWSESPEDPNKMLKAHSEFIDGPIHLFGLEGDVDVMIESKGKELALLEYRQYILDGRTTVGPRQARVAKFAADAAAAAAADDSEGGAAGEDSSDDAD